MEASKCSVKYIGVNINEEMTSSHDVPTPEGLDNWSGDVSLLPNITWLDITSYLIKTPSIFSKESLRAYKSLEAYDYFVCGHVQDCFYHPISEDDIFCFIKTQVLPSQRQAEKTVMYDVWVCVHKQEGWGSLCELYLYGRTGESVKSCWGATI